MGYIYSSLVAVFIDQGNASSMDNIRVINPVKDLWQSHKVILQDTYLRSFHQNGGTKIWNMTPVKNPR